MTPVERTPAAELRDEYVICRTLGHSWDDNPTAEVDSEWQSYSVGLIALRCVRCATERFDYIGNDMGVAYRYYRYPDAWATVVGEGRRPNLRGVMVTRSLLIHTWAQRNGNGRNGNGRRK